MPHFAYTVVNPNQLIVAKAFYAASCVCGVPSLLGFIWGVWGILQFHLLTPASHNAPEQPTGNTAVDLLQMGAKAAGAVFGAIGTLGSWVIYAVTSAAVLGLLLSTALYLTGRGLYAGQIWAKLTGTAFLSLLLLLSLTAGPFATRVALAGFSGYSLWVLWARTT